jgi:predicted 3-demethylubiquinone-9 3-methyltransferase (glyoxalase superfamily)
VGRKRVHARLARYGRAVARRAHASADDASRADARKPVGSMKVVEFTLMGPPFMAISAGPLDPFNHAVSFVVLCDVQAQDRRHSASIACTEVARQGR